MKPWSIPLLPFSVAYGAGMALRNWAFDHGWKKTHRLPVTILSLGNITVGGTGKTPMAAFLLERLLSMHLRPAYLSRGYGRATRGFLDVQPSDPRGALAFGDEALLVAGRFPQVPVAVCEDRVEGVKRLLSKHDLDVVVLDDAFQHRRIGRDLDWVIVDCSRPPMQDWTMPAGRLREGSGSLSRAQAFILTKFNNEAEARTIEAQLLERFPDKATAAFEMRPLAMHPFGSEALKEKPPVGTPCVAFSGLGNNAHFASTLKSLGLDLREHFCFPDHHPYSEADLDKISKSYSAQKEIKGKLPPALILTTEKDYFRLKRAPWLQRFAHLPLTYLAVGMVPVWGWEQLETKIKDSL